jgi:hypothetical protein
MNTITVDRESVDHSVNVGTQSIPLYLYATILASLSIIIGLIWDISWHMSIGRDGLLSAPHLAIYVGGVTAGIFSGLRVLKLTFAGTPIERAGAVRFWSVFYGSVGNLFCIWGAIAMLTSAPFDDWWHNTYGLDVTILSPPHTVLLLGMITIQFGAIVSVLAFKNNSTTEDRRETTFQWMFALSAGFVLCMVYTIASEYLDRHDMKGGLFYIVCSVIFPLFLISFSVASKAKWGATQATIVYSFLLMLMNWILPLFPASPKLGPVLNPVTAFQPFDFPLLLIVPAILIDWITHRQQHRHKWVQAFFYSLAFLVSFFAVQYPFGDVLMASKGHWFFGTSKWYFGMDPNWPNRYAYAPDMIDTLPVLLQSLAIAIVIGVMSARTGIAFGGWMKRIVR